MAMEWKTFSSGDAAQVKTDLITLYVDVDMPATRREGALRFSARVLNKDSLVLRSQDGMGSMSEAQSWCEQEYASLLSNELARVRG